MTYTHRRDGWPDLRWSDAQLASRLASVRHRQGRLIGRMESLGFSLREEAILQTLTEDVIQSSEIEGEHLDRGRVRSSIARRLGMDVAGLVPSDRNVEGVVEMMLDATQRFAEALSTDRLFGWHAALLPTGRSGMARIAVGKWLDDASGPMQVVSGPIGREPVHFEAPSADRLDDEMTRFLAWFEAGSSIDPVLKAAIAHLWFVTIHPFDDGNGRIARAIADMALARSEGSAQRFCSMSAQIRAERNAYYDNLESTQKGNLDITSWVAWFLDCPDRAFDGTERILASVFRRASFWEAYAATPMSDRQRAMANRLLTGFEGKLNTSKWAKVAKRSQDTALRDIDELVRHGVLTKGDEGGGAPIICWL